MFRGLIQALDFPQGSCLPIHTLVRITRTDDIYLSEILVFLLLTWRGLCMIVFLYHHTEKTMHDSISLSPHGKDYTQ